MALNEFPCRQVARSRWPNTKIKPSTNLPSSLIILPGWPKARGDWKRFQVDLRAKAEELGAEPGPQSWRVTCVQFSRVVLSGTEFGEKEGRRPGILFCKVSGKRSPFIPGNGTRREGANPACYQ